VAVIEDQNSKNSSELMVSNELRATLFVQSYYQSEAILTLLNWTEQIEECSLVFNSFAVLASKDHQIPLSSIPLKEKSQQQNCSF